MHLHGRVRWPVAHRKYVHSQIYGAWLALVLHVLKTKQEKASTVEYHQKKQVCEKVNGVIFKIQLNTRLYLVLRTHSTEATERLFQSHLGYFSCFSGYITNKGCYCTCLSHIFVNAFLGIILLFHFEFK